MKHKGMIEMKNVVYKVTKKGGVMALGVCPQDGTKMAKILSINDKSIPADQRAKLEHEIAKIKGGVDGGKRSKRSRKSGSKKSKKSRKSKGSKKSRKSGSKKSKRSKRSKKSRKSKH